MFQEEERSDRRRKNVMGNYNYYKMFGCFNRKFKISEMGPPPDVIDVFQSYSMGESEMLPDTFLRFLIEFQGEESTTMEDAQDIMDRILNHSRSHLTRYAFNIHDFFHYLLLDDLNGPIQTKVHHDMSAPLQHYFIYTGHNSYLTGNQLSSDSSEVPIIKALQREHAFVNSSYPVVITLEDHLTPNLQAKVAEVSFIIPFDMVTNTFGEMLYCPKPSDKDEFPSPDSLRHQIILSTKPPKEYLRSKNPRKERSSLDKDSSEEESASKRNNENEIASSSRSRRLSEILGVDYEDDDIEYEKSGQQAAPQYKHLIAIHASKPKKGTRRALMDEPGKAKRLNSHKSIFFGCSPREHGLPPQTLDRLRHGCMGYGRSLWMMHGMFRSNGGCGYVKKPEFLMTKGPNGEVFDPKAILPVKTTLKVYIVGVPVDVAKKRTRVIGDDWTPIWNEEFTFPLRVPELALLEIVVQEYDVDKDDFAGQTCLPVSELRPGIRVVPLHNKKGEKFKSVKLLMRFLFV
ncbi:hypothetical protein Ccrd_016818 [Cynara cardunculus var. scolymus]|uniref:Phosphoinositide phospholipase C n=1 Tax=Cynara cardunculus var. scolymus TaxID=59895 RepID=A0A103Y967_CYNCS|nr:hypothetical protein Ccrd_016818 [Cynara cardunculus var. scolymus]